MTKIPVLAAAVLASATLVGAAVAGCTSNKKSSTSSTTSTSSSTAMPSAGSTSAKSSSATPGATDYSGLLIKLTDISGNERWVVDTPPKPNQAGPGAEVTFRNEAGTRAIFDSVLIFSDAAQAQTGLDGGKKSLTNEVTGTPQPVDVGTGGTMVSGTKPDGSAAITALLFTEGRAFVDMVFSSAPDDPVPPDAVIDLGQKQDTAIKNGLPA